MKQTTFASMAWTAKGKVTRRKRFLAEMSAVVRKLPRRVDILPVDFSGR